MKIQLKILIETLRKNFLWIIIFVLLVILSLIFYFVRPNTIELTPNDFLSMICYPKTANYSLMCFLLTMYQVGLIIYIIYNYYTHEFEHSFENIILRTKEKKWIRQKCIIISLFIVFSRLLYVSLLYLYFYNKFSFQPDYLLYPILYQLFISIVVITTINILKREMILEFLIVFIVTYVTMFIFNPVIIFILYILLIIINCIYFQFKKMIF